MSLLLAQETDNTPHRLRDHPLGAFQSSEECAKNGARGRRTASEKNVGKWSDSAGSLSPSPQSPSVVFTHFP